MAEQLARKGSEHVMVNAHAAWGPPPQAFPPNVIRANQESLRRRGRFGLAGRLRDLSRAGGRAAGGSWWGAQDDGDGRALQPRHTERRTRTSPPTGATRAKYPYGAPVGRAWRQADVPKAWGLCPARCSRDLSRAAGHAGRLAWVWRSR